MQIIKEPFDGYGKKVDGITYIGRLPLEIESDFVEMVLGHQDDRDVCKKAFAGVSYATPQGPRLDETMTLHNSHLIVK